VRGVVLGADADVEKHEVFVVQMLSEPGGGDNKRRSSRRIIRDA
jgi:hypothetical protein